MRLYSYPVPGTRVRTGTIDLFRKAAYGGRRARIEEKKQGCERAITKARVKNTRAHAHHRRNRAFHFAYRLINCSISTAVNRDSNIAIFFVATA